MKDEKVSMEFLDSDPVEALNPQPEKPTPPKTTQPQPASTSLRPKKNTLFHHYLVGLRKSIRVGKEVKWTSPYVAPTLIYVVLLVKIGFTLLLLLTGGIASVLRNALLRYSRQAVQEMKDRTPLETNVYRFTRLLYWLAMVPLSIFIIPFLLLRFFGTGRGFAVLILMAILAAGTYSVWYMQPPAATPFFSKLKIFKPAHPFLCRYYLRGFAKAKAQWAEATGRSPGHPCLISDLEEEVDLTLFECPSGGRYDIGAIQVIPNCTASNHFIKIKGWYVSEADLPDE